MTLRRELALKGVPRDVVEEAMSKRGGGDSQEADRTAAHALLRRKRALIEGEPNPAKRRHKAFALLARNGFDADVAREIASEFVAASSTAE